MMDYIIVNVNGKEKKAELVSRFELQNKDSYVIYKLDGEYYGAKYIVEDGNTTLITDLSNSEKLLLNEIFKNLEEN